MLVSDSKKNANLSLKLVFHVAAIDDTEFVLGIPSLPIPLSVGGASVQTPEISLFSSSTQKGKIRFSVYAKDLQSGTLAFIKDSEPAKKFYSRWSAFLIFGWRVTDLGRPF